MSFDEQPDEDHAECKAAYETIVAECNRLRGENEIFRSALGKKGKAFVDLVFERNSLRSQVRAQAATITAMREIVKGAKEIELFHDGVDVDLRSDGIDNIASAYAEGRNDAIGEIEEAMNTFSASQAEKRRCGGGLTEGGCGG